MVVLRDPDQTFDVNKRRIDQTGIVARPRYPHGRAVVRKNARKSQVASLVSPS